MSTLEDKRIELYNGTEMPLSDNPKTRAMQERIIRGEKLSLMDYISFGRDRVTKLLGSEYACRPDYCYKAISWEAYEKYQKEGFIINNSDYKEVVENGVTYNNNAGVHWYLGGAAARYGDIIIECPADKRYFRPTYDYGFGLSDDINVRHLVSSGKTNPIPFSMITNVFNIQDMIMKKQEEVLSVYEEAAADSSKSIMIVITGGSKFNDSYNYKLITIDKITGEKKIVQDITLDYLTLEYYVIDSLCKSFLSEVDLIESCNDNLYTYRSPDNTRIIQISNLANKQINLICSITSAMKRVNESSQTIHK